MPELTKGLKAHRFIFTGSMTVLASSASPRALMKAIKPRVVLALWGVTVLPALTISQSAPIWAANIESSGGDGGASSNGRNGTGGATGTNGVGGKGGDGGVGTGTPTGAGVGGTGGSLGASTVDPTSSTPITGGDGSAGVNGTLSQNQNAGGGGGGGGGGTGVVSADTAFESKAVINGGKGGNGGSGITAYASDDTSGSSGGYGGGGGAGVYYGSATTATNSGAIQGGNGGSGGSGTDGKDIDFAQSVLTRNGGSGGYGGAGGAAAIFSDGVIITNSSSGSIRGGAGGMGGDAGTGGTANGYVGTTPSGGGTGAIGGNGRDGGDGVSVSGGGTLNNDGTIRGGTGGQGGKGGNGGSGMTFGGAGGAGGAGGNGGVAVNFSATATITNTGYLSGGQGAAGADGGDSGTSQSMAVGGLTSGNGGAGGNGGVAVQLLGMNNSVINNGGIITGGGGNNGGKGGDPFAVLRYSYRGSFGYSSNGGNGAAALVLGDTSTVTNTSGTIQGGDAGGGGHQPGTNASSPPPGTGGLGGNGITANKGSTITNAGTIAGGRGGSGGASSSSFGTAGLGGYGILLSGSDGKVVNSGAISGGQSGNGTIRAFAVSFTGGTSTLELHAGSNIIGDVVAQGTGNTFILGGDDNDTFAGQVTSVTTGTAQYRGFQSNVKDGASTWTLTGASESWTVRKGVLQLGDGAITNQGDITGNVITGTDATTKGTFAFNRKLLVFNGLISGTGGVEQKGPADSIVSLTADNTYTGGTVISSGTLRLGNTGTTGSIVGEVTNNGTLAFNRSDSLTFDGLISGSGSVLQIGLGTTILTADSTYTGGTTVSAGVLQIGDGHVTGSILGNASIAANTTLAFNRSDALDFDGVVSGAGLLKQLGAGALSLNGDSSGFTGKTSVSSGTLLVHGALGGTVEVAANASLGGDGALTGDATLDAGGANLVGREGQVLTFEKDLTLTAGNNVNVALGAPSINGLFHVKGHLTLDGTLNVTDQGGFGPGLYRIFDYDGALTDNGLALGTVPGGDISQMALQTNIANQINLVNAAGASLNFWNGGDANLHGNGTINGGDGVWNSADQNWTELDGVISGVWKDDDFAIFTGASGIVTVSNGGGAVTASGMQFSTDGYRLEGNALTLADDVAPIIRVDKDVTATIKVELQGTQGLNKTDFGTLILTGENHYSGGTTVSEGILQLGDGGNSGSIDGDVVLARTAYDYGTLAFNRSDTLSFAGAISGEGEVLQQGEGTTTFTGNNSYSGGLTIENGTAQAGIADTAFGSGRLTVNAGATADLHDFNTTVTGLLNGKDGGGAVMLGTGTLTLNQGFDSTFSGIISGDGGLTKNGSGTLTFFGANIYNGTTELNDGTLKQGVQGGFSNASAYITGSDGTLMLNGFDTAMVSLENSGVTDFGVTGGTVLTVAGNYTGGGTLIINTVLGDDSSKTDLLKVGGETSGTTTVKVNNRGGLGAQTNEGIRIITIGGQSSGQFNLSGTLTKDGRQAVVAGAYAYTLHQGGVSTPDDGDWYLRSERTDGGGPDYNPGAPVYEGYAQTLQALNKLSTLQQRVGNRYWSHAANPVIEQGADALGTPLVPADAAIDASGIWGRIEGAHNRFEANRSTTAMKQEVNTLILQAGVDGQLYEGETGKLIGGITGQYGKARSDIVSAQSDGKIDTQGWGLGGTLTWYGDNGFYADTQAQAMWYDSDLNYITDNTNLINGNKGFGYGLSLEAGKRIDLSANWSLTPQAQLVWSSVKFDTFNDAWGASVSGRNGDSLNARLGVSADYRSAWRDANGMTTRSTVYGIVNLYQEFMSGNKVTVADLDFDNENDKTWGGIAAGGTYAWADDKYALYGEGSLNTSLSNFAKSYAVKGTVGFRVRW